MEYTNTSKGISFLDVKFSDEESIVNFILRCVAKSNSLLADIDPQQLDDEVVILRITPKMGVCH